MSDYSPDRWVVVKIVTAKERLYKVFASWSGGYGGSDSWKMNSGITRASLVGSLTAIVDPFTVATRKHTEPMDMVVMCYRTLLTRCPVRAPPWKSCLKQQTGPR